MCIRKVMIVVKISEVSSTVGISSDTLRYYEKIGLITDIARDSNGIREYSDHDIQIIYFVKCMRGAGLSIDALRKYLELFNEGEHTAFERRAILIEQRELLDERLNEMLAVKERLDYKIENYDKTIALKEELLTKINLEKQKVERA